MRVILTAVVQTISAARNEYESKASRRKTEEPAAEAPSAETPPAEAAPVAAEPALTPA